MSNLERMLNTWDEADSELNKKIDNTNLSTIVASATVSATNSKTIKINGTGKAVEKLVIEGKTEQNGIPSPSTPVEIKGVGEYVGNIFDKTKVVNGYGYNINDKTLGTNANLCYEYISIEPTMKSITITGQENLNSSTFANAFLDADKKYISTINLKNSVDDVTINIPNNARFIVITAFKAESSYELDTIKVIVNKYKIPISCNDKTQNIYLDEPLFSSETTDITSGIVNKNQKLKTFDGSESWVESVISTSGYINVVLDNACDNAKKTGGYDYTPSICNITPSGTDYKWRDSTAELMFVVMNGSIGLRIPTSIIPNLSAWKTYLSTHNLNVVYELATEIKETFDGVKIHTSVGKNTLTLSTEVTPTSIEATTFGDYYSKTEMNIMLGEINGELYQMIKDTQGTIDDINEEISKLEKYNEQILGVSADFQNNTYTRLEQAVGLTAGADFDKFAVYHLKRCNVSDDGTVTAYYGDPNFKEDGSNGQVMVEIPKVYYKMTPTKLETNTVGYHIRSANYYVSNMKSQGFKLHPAFIRPDKSERDFVYVGAYDGSLYDTSVSTYLLNDEQVADFTADKLSSIANARPTSGITQNLTRANANLLATNRGTGWNCETIQIASLIQLLFIIEYAGFNTQTLLGDGITGITDNSSYNCASFSGSTSSLGNTSGKASSTKGYNGTNHTATNQVAVSYRGIENPWGNIWKFITGMNIYGNGSQQGGVPYICDNTTFTEDTISGYTSAGFSVATSYGYISAFGYGNADYDWLFIGSESSGDSTKPVGDYTYTTSNLNGYRIAQLGGGWNDGSNAGGFYWRLISSSSSWGRHFGARLCFNP